VGMRPVGTAAMLARDAGMAAGLLVTPARAAGTQVVEIGAMPAGIEVTAISPRQRIGVVAAAMQVEAVAAMPMTIRAREEEDTGEVGLTRGTPLPSSRK
jgi:hypothetical protein